MNTEPKSVLGFISLGSRDEFEIFGTLVGL
jgi:hypothetical protein